MRKFLLLSALSITSVAGLAQSDVPKDLYLTKDISDATFRKIHAKTSHGNIEILPVSGNNDKIEIFIQGKEDNHTLSKDEIRSMMEEYYNLDISVSGDVLTIAANKKISFFNGKRWLSISFRIYTGKEKSTDLETDHGNIHIAGMTGSQDLTTDHGNIDVKEISGPVVAKTWHGNIKLTAAKNDIEARTDHGDVEIEEGYGKVKLLTSNGNIKIRNVKGNVRADTDHGDITGDQIGGDLTASTSHGNIHLDRLACSVDASTDHGNLNVNFDKLTGTTLLKNSNGDISLDVPKADAIDLDLHGKKVVVGTIANFSGTRGNDVFRGKMNGGGLKVTAKTVKGQVDLEFK